MNRGSEQVLKKQYCHEKGVSDNYSKIYEPDKKKNCAPFFLHSSQRKKSIYPKKAVYPDDRQLLSTLHFKVYPNYSFFCILPILVSGNPQKHLYSNYALVREPGCVVLNQHPLRPGYQGECSSAAHWNQIF